MVKDNRAIPNGQFYNIFQTKNVFKKCYIQFKGYFIINLGNILFSQ